MRTQPTISPPAQQPEEWRPVAGHDDYQVSDCGRVRSRRTPNGKKRDVIRWRVLKTSRYPHSGYVHVSLADADGRFHHHMVHRLVLETFVGPCPPGMQTRHLDGVRDNNRVGNLCWGTGKENAADRRRHGTMLEGEAHPNVRFTQEQVKEMKRLRKQKVPYRVIGERFGISSDGAYHYIRRRWKHLD